MTRLLLALVCAPLLLQGCVRQVRTGPALPPPLTVTQVEALIPDRVPARGLWAEDVLGALHARGIHPSADAVCQVLAVVEQESGFKADPEVPNLARVVKKRLRAWAKKLGPVGPTVMETLLEGKAEGSKRTFAQRLDRVRTERDLDLVFRDLLRYHQSGSPVTFALVDLTSAALGKGTLQEQNPITTAGSMQVSVRYAVQVAEEDAGDEVDEWEVRDRLYTREGGVYFGAARLLEFEAGYDAPLYRFADFNAGFYASRNAAVQEQVAALTGVKLALDGDLLAWDKEGAPAAEDSRTLKALLRYREKYAPWISERQLRREVQLEKTRAFEDTDIWRALKASYRAVKEKEPAYARLPEVTLKSPKLSRDRSTAWFARAVDRRYQRCRAAAPDPAARRGIPSGKAGGAREAE